VDVRRARPLLGTLVGIGVDACDERRALRAIGAAFDEIGAVHRLMSFHAGDSDLSRLHRDAHRAPQQLDARTFEVLACALAFARESRGVFDPTIASELVARGFLPRPQGRLADDDATWRDVELLPDRRVRFARPLWIDLGGIAKGYAVDRAIDVLRAHDVRVALVNAGGDLRRIGEGSATIHVRDPKRPSRVVPLVALGDGALATSANAFSSDDDASLRIGTHLDGVARRFVRHSTSVSVLAPTCIVADALTKVALADRAVASRMLAAHAAQACESIDGRWLPWREAA
jgi:thiamine biosynthesis lipoprotein